MGGHCSQNVQEHTDSDHFSLTRMPTWPEPVHGWGGGPQRNPTHPTPLLSSLFYPKIVGKRGLLFYTKRPSVHKVSGGMGSEAKAAQWPFPKVDFPPLTKGGGQGSISASSREPASLVFFSGFWTPSIDFHESTQAQWGRGSPALGVPTSSLFLALGGWTPFWRGGVSKGPACFSAMWWLAPRHPPLLTHSSGTTCSLHRPYPTVCCLLAPQPSYAARA